MKERVFKVISVVLNIPIDTIKDDSSPDTIEEWDSLKHMNLIVSLEEEFGVEFNDSEIIRMLEVSTIIEILKKKN